MYKLLFLVTLFFVVSCGSEDKPKNLDEQNDVESSDVLDVDSTDTIEVISDYNLDGVDPKIRDEFKKNLAKIEVEHGVQWDFCTCVIKNDSIDKAFKKANLPEKEFTRLANRFDVIGEKCNAFLAQNPNQTPDDRAKHDKKVRNCLKAAKIK